MNGVQVYNRRAAAAEVVEYSTGSGLFQKYPRAAAAELDQMAAFTLFWLLATDSWLLKSTLASHVNIFQTLP